MAESGPKLFVADAADVEYKRGDDVRFAAESAAFMEGLRDTSVSDIRGLRIDAAGRCAAVGMPYERTPCARLSKWLCRSLWEYLLELSNKRYQTADDTAVWTFNQAVEMAAAERKASSRILACDTTSGRVVGAYGTKPAAIPAAELLAKMRRHKLKLIHARRRGIQLDVLYATNSKFSDKQLFTPAVLFSLHSTEDSRVRLMPAVHSAALDALFLGDGDGVFGVLNRVRDHDQMFDDAVARVAATADGKIHPDVVSAMMRLRVPFYGRTVDPVRARREAQKKIGRHGKWLTSVTPIIAAASKHPADSRTPLAGAAERRYEALTWWDIVVTISRRNHPRYSFDRQQELARLAYRLCVGLETDDA